MSSHAAIREGRRRGTGMSGELGESMTAESVLEAQDLL